MHTYHVLVNPAAYTRTKSNALGKSLNRLIRKYLPELACRDGPEQSIEEFRSLSGKGHSCGWRPHRNEIHER